MTDYALCVAMEAISSKTTVSGSMSTTLVNVYCIFRKEMIWSGCLSNILYLSKYLVLGRFRYISLNDLTSFVANPNCSMTLCRYTVLTRYSVNGSPMLCWNTSMPYPRLELSSANCEDVYFLEHFQYICDGLEGFIMMTFPVSPWVDSKSNTFLPSKQVATNFPFIFRFCDTLMMNSLRVLISLKK